MIRFDPLMLPLLKALANLGGSASVAEIYTKVVERLLNSNDNPFTITGQQYHQPAATYTIDNI